MCGYHPTDNTYNQAGNHRNVEAPALTPASTHTTPCPQCRSPLQEDFVFCPHCGAEVLAACPACHRAVRADWTHCAYCGAELLGEKADVPTHSHP